MSNFLNKLFKRKENSYRIRDMFVCPKRSVKGQESEKVRSFAQWSLFYKTSKGSVRENEEKTSYIDDIDGHESNLEKEAHQTQHSQQPEYKNQSKKKMSLEDLKRTSPPGFEEFETAVALKELDEEIALLLWEDIFKPLSSHFKSLQEEKSLQYTSIYSHCK